MFPYITHIDDVLPHIQGRDEFTVAVRENHTVINYQVIFSDTFPDLDDETSKIRRECRGIIFDENGCIIRRPLEKFFNVGEREETQPHNLNWLDRAVITDKLDGSMISPYIVNDELIWGTKAGDTDIARYVRDNVVYERHKSLALNLISSGYTPIFEYTAPTNQIVLTYEEPELTLLAIREMISGYYLPRSSVESFAYQFSVPCVKRHQGVEVKTFLDSIKNMQDIEGFILECPNTSYKVKSKCDWYVSLHKTLEHIHYEKDVIRLLLNNELDDAKQILPEADVKALDEYNDILVRGIYSFSDHIWRSMLMIWNACEENRKEFAKQVSPERDKNFYFKALDCYLLNPYMAYSPSEKFQSFVLDFVKKSTSSQTTVDNVRFIWNDSWQSVKERNEI